MSKSYAHHLQMLYNHLINVLIAMSPGSFLGVCVEIKNVHC